MQEIDDCEASCLKFLNCKISYSSYNFILNDLNNCPEVTLHSPHWNVELRDSIQIFSAKFLLGNQEQYIYCEIYWNLFEDFLII